MAKRVSSSKPGPSADTRILVLYGPEEMQKRQALTDLRAALAGKDGEVETVNFDGKTAALADVFDELRSMSLMQNPKIVLVDDADVFVTAHREPLERYAANPSDTATLVLRSTKWNKGNLDKHIEKVGAMIKCEPLSPAEAVAWTSQRAASEHKAKIESSAAALLAERLGGDIGLIDNELAKLALLAGEGETITKEIVTQVVGRSSEEDAWAIQEAVLASLAGDSKGAAVDKLHELVGLSGQPDILVAYFVADLMRKLYLGLMMKKQGMNDFQVGKELKLWGPRADAFMRGLKKLNERSLSVMLDRIVELDVRAKSGRGEALRNLECFCAVMGDEMR